MFIEEGSTRVVYCFPSQGFVVKVPREEDGRKEYGIIANKAEAYFWSKTHNPLLAPVLFSKPSGEVVVMPYYPKTVQMGAKINREAIAVLSSKDKEEIINCLFPQIVERILGANIKTFVGDAHVVQGYNFRLDEEGKLRMSDYGVLYKDDMLLFEEFLATYGEKLVAEYSEPPISEEYLCK